MSSSSRVADVVSVTRTDPNVWQATLGGNFAGRGDLTYWPDGRIFISIDSWHDHVFDRLAEAMLETVPGQVYTLADSGDLDVVSSWQRAGLVVSHHWFDYTIPTEIVEAGTEAPRDDLVFCSAEKAPLGAVAELEQSVRAELTETGGWVQTPLEVRGGTRGQLIPDLSQCVLIGGECAGFVRVRPLFRSARLTHRVRLGLVAIRPEYRRQGLARALLRHTLVGLAQAGFHTAHAEVAERNVAAIALTQGLGAIPVATTVELVRHGE